MMYDRVGFISLCHHSSENSANPDNIQNLATQYFSVRLKMGRPKNPQAPKKSDKEQIDEQLGDFKPAESPFVVKFMSFFGKPRHRVILVICNRIAELEHIPQLSRRFRRQPNDP
jgi:hypothetical protein